MSYRKRLHPPVSNAEMEVFRALSAEGLTEGMVTQQPIILKATTPDFAWFSKRKAVYLDGVQAHSKSEEHDLEIDELLKAKGWSVLRISYDPPLTQNQLREIISQVKEALGK